MNNADFVTPFPGLGEFESGDYDRALLLLLPLAENGHAEAQCMVGNIYHLGLGGVVPDLPSAIAQSATKSFEWYNRAAAQGYGVASSNLAGMYLSGSGVPADSEQARQLYEQARSQGFIHAPKD